MILRFLDRDVPEEDEIEVVVVDDVVDHAGMSAAAGRLPAVQADGDVVRVPVHGPRGKCPTHALPGVRPDAGVEEQRAAGDVLSGIVGASHHREASGYSATRVLYSSSTHTCNYATRCISDFVRLNKHV